MSFFSFYFSSKRGISYLRGNFFLQNINNVFSQDETLVYEQKLSSWQLPTFSMVEQQVRNTYHSFTGLKEKVLLIKKDHFTFCSNIQ